MVRIKDALNIDAETRIIYKKIQNECYGFRLTNLQIFKLALAVGYRNSRRLPLVKKDRFIRITSSDTDFNSLVYLIAIDELDIEQCILNDNPSEIYELAEEYANAGIRIIHKTLKYGDSDFYTMLEKIIFETYSKNNLAEALNRFK